MTKYGLITIGGSAGSLTVLLQLLPLLSTNLITPMLFVLHRKETDDYTLAALLSSKTDKTVKEAEEKEQIKPHTIYLAPVDYHLLIEKEQTFSLDFSEKINYSRPSIDVSFESAAAVFKERLLGIILSGANADGAAGLSAIKAHGGYTIVQDPDTAEVAVMPQKALEVRKADAIMTVEEMAGLINSLG